MTALGLPLWPQLSDQWELEARLWTRIRAWVDLLLEDRDPAAEWLATESLVRELYVVARKAVEVERLEALDDTDPQVLRAAENLAAIALRTCRRQLEQIGIPEPARTAWAQAWSKRTAKDVALDYAIARADQGVEEAQAWIQKAGQLQARLQRIESVVDAYPDHPIARALREAARAEGGADGSKT